MTADLNLYHDREHSFIKHQFLTKYLQAAAYRILQGRSRTFNFVDAFAGPWRVSDEAKYSDASFDQAINTLEDVRVDLAGRGVDGLKIRSCFCEKTSTAAAHLREYAESKVGFEIHVFEGAFEDNLSDIASTLTDGFAFTFIDPTGWNIGNKDIFNFLRGQNGEFMFNFMSDHINRHAGYDEVRASFGRFLANADWRNEFEVLPAEWSNGKKILDLIKHTMRKNKVATYLPDFSIMVPKREREKMRLILGTHSPEGVKVFRDVQKKVEEQEVEMRHDLRHGDAPQVCLFSSEDIVEMQQKNEGVGCAKYRRLAEEFIVNDLRERICASADSIQVKAMEDVPIRRTDLNKLLNDMRRRGIVHFELPKRKRVPLANTKISLT